MKEELKSKCHLTGGTFLFLMLEAKSDIDKEGKDIPNYAILSGLAKIFGCELTDTFVGTSATQQTSKYKSGDAKAPAFMGLYSSKNVDLFDARYKSATGYRELCAEMHRFIDNNLHIDNNNTWLIDALLDVISNDQNIAPSDLLYKSIKGNDIKKSDISTETSVYVPGFLLGLWHFILLRSENLKATKESYVAWKKRLHDGTIGVDRSLFTSGGKLPLVFDCSPMLVSPITEQNVEKGDTSKSLVEKVLSGDYAELKEMLKGTERGKRANPIFDYLEDVMLEQLGEPAPEIREYLKKAKKHYATLQTLLTFKDDQPFTKSFVCSDLAPVISTKAEVVREERNILNNPDPFKLLTYYNSPHVLICGIGGMGKSMLLTHFLHVAIDQYPDKRVVPVIVPVREYEGNCGIITFVQQYLHKRFSWNLREEILETMLDTGRFLIMFDGIDEISDDLSKEFKGELTIFLDKHEKAEIIMTSRPVGFSGPYNIIRRALPLEILPFTLEQSVEMIKKVHGYDSKKEEFIRCLKTELFRTHKSFAEVPLLLTIMFLTHITVGKIPSHLSDFYNEAYRALAYRHDAIKEGTYERTLKTGLTKERFADYFAEFCARTYFSDDINHEFTEGQIENIYQTLNCKKKDNCQAETRHFIEDATSALCLFIYDGLKYHFTHRSFEEYFCARFYSRFKPKKLKAIGDMYENKRVRFGGDRSFDMLYEMIPGKVEEYIFVPFLEEYLFPYENDEDNYKHFLIDCYEYYYYGEGFDYEYDDGTATTSFLYEFILEKYGISFDKEAPPKFMDDYFIHKTYVYVAVGEYPDAKPISMQSSTAILDMDYYDYSPDDAPDIAGTIFKCDFATLFGRQERFEDTIEAIMDDSFSLRQEYMAVKKLYLDLKKKFENSVEDMFDPD